MTAREEEGRRDRELFCRDCGLRGAVPGTNLRFSECFNECSDHYGHVLSNDHPACGWIRHRREVPGNVHDISDERPRQGAMGREDG